MKDMVIKEWDELNDELLCDCIELITETVNDGASIGFLAPLTKEEAHAYWSCVIEPGVRIWGAFDHDGKLAGSIQLHLAMKSNGQHRAEVAKLMVHPRYRRRGIAKALMKSAEEAAKEENRSLLILDTREGDPSNDLYLAFGYREAGRIPHFAKSSDGTYHSTVIYFKVLEAL
ncbi:GNAT family N-acetyltransferase [Paenibacillus sp. 1001270B_150601_E10]|uniref:GNAT family N-acetyltransferase n=1 Tax=Paenibacillus sp. 1001270B_150601_E10 TaxID=2787079 RepID=UPI0018A089DD|nr:GNAT family N-acetyltransferase [Paenibacillus sp. 1001270B_150601_E10]